MKLFDLRKRISIYINQRDSYQKKTLFRALIEKFYEIGVSGVSVFRSTASYGTNFLIHSQEKELPFFRNRGVVLVIIETERKSNQILQIIDNMVSDGIVTIEPIEMIRYTTSEVTQEDGEIIRDSAPNSLGGEIE